MQFVENVTDIDDKIILRAQELNTTPKSIADKYSEEYRKSLTKLGVPEPDNAPRVSEYIDQIIQYIKELIDGGYAYESGEGNVYFEVSKYKEYGKLSGRKLDNEKSGVRKTVEKDKRNVADFALWKSDTAAGASWPSPWGSGRPGWHIECSVMSNDILGQSIDIHCGGLDLLFPHHENEKAQCEAHNGTQFVKYWTHCGLLNIDGLKMSKSLGNFITVDEALEKYGKELIVFVILRHHYRSAIDLQDKLFRDSLNSLRNFYTLISRDIVANNIDALKSNNKHVENLIQDFEKEMDNDFNTPGAIVVLAKYLELSVELKKAKQNKELTELHEAIVFLGQILGLFQNNDLTNLTQEMLKFQHESLKTPELLSADAIDNLIGEREKARVAKDFAKSDYLRDALNLHGISVMDGDENRTSWEFSAK